MPTALLQTEPPQRSHQAPVQKRPNRLQSSQSFDDAAADLLRKPQERSSESSRATVRQSVSDRPKHDKSSEPGASNPHDQVEAGATATSAQTAKVQPQPTADPQKSSSVEQLPALAVNLNASNIAGNISLPIAADREGPVYSPARQSNLSVAGLAGAEASTDNQTVPLAGQVMDIIEKQAMSALSAVADNFDPASLNGQTTASLTEAAVKAKSIAGDEEALAQAGRNNPSDIRHTENQASQGRSISSAKAIIVRPEPPTINPVAIVNQAVARQAELPINVESARLPQAVSASEIPVTMARMASGMKPGESSNIRMRIDPPSLGTVHVSIDASDRGVSIRVVTQTQEASSLLQQSQHQLRDELSRWGLDLNHFSTSQSFEGWKSFQDGRPQDNSGSAARRMRFAVTGPDNNASHAYSLTLSSRLLDARA